MSSGPLAAGTAAYSPAAAPFASVAAMAITNDSAGRATGQRLVRAHGAGMPRAEQLATLIVAAVEGTVARCRAQRSTQPLDHVNSKHWRVIGDS